MIKYPIAALVVVIALLGGFYGGYKIGGGGTASAAATSGTSNGAGTGVGTRTGLGRGFAACPSTSTSPSATTTLRRGASGTVTNLTANSLTVHDARCNTDVKVTFDQSVIVRKTVVGQASDLQETQTITVTGTRQADGSIKANTISIVPAGAGTGGFGGLGGGGGATGG